MSGNLNENPDANPNVGNQCIDQVQEETDELYCYGGKISIGYLEKVFAACSKCEHYGNCAFQREIKLILDFRPVAGGWPDFIE